jgi:hypothetical protein
MRRLLIAAAFLSGVAGGCFLKPNAAPGFRFSCESDADCLARRCDGALIPMADAADLVEGCESEEVVADTKLGVGYRQTCVAGLCEFPCSFYTVADDCPPAAGYSFCFNGRCANICGTDVLDKYGFDSTDDFCTQPQRCVPFGEDDIDPALFGMSSINPDSLPDGAGFCGLRCDAEGAPDCPPGEYCTGAVCLPGCNEPNATPCAEGSTCFAYGSLTACLISCADDPCPEDLVCVPGLDICRPSCVDVEGQGAADCEDGFECNMDLGVCVPLDIGGSSETGSEGGSEESSG